MNDEMEIVILTCVLTVTASLTVLAMSIAWAP